jgi:sugar O-acyltransferase (sialic acid O-acetyltransferase NeuD family)
MKKLAIIGSAVGGGAAQIIDALSGDTTYNEVIIFDHNLSVLGSNVMGVNVVDSSENILKWHKDGKFDCAVIGIGTPSERAKLFRVLSREGVNFVNVIDPTANIRPTARLGLGNVILANVYIGPFVTIGDNNYIITSTTINHHSNVGSHCYLSSGCTLAGRVKLGDKVRFDTASGAKGDVTVSSGTVVPAGQILGE